MKPSKAVKLPVPTKLKCEPSIPSSSDSELEVTVTATSASDGLPSFAQAGWATRFIPTLGHCLASALNPWDIGNGTDILVVIQGVLEKAYPSSSYQVKFGDKVYLMV
jgi:hypothetical protein